MRTLSLAFTTEAETSVCARTFVLNFCMRTVQHKCCTVHVQKLRTFGFSGIAPLEGQDVSRVQAIPPKAPKENAYSQKSGNVANVRSSR